MRKILFILLTAFTTIAFSQAPSIQWQISLGSTGYDQANVIQNTSDKGYIVAGSASANNGDVSGWHGSNDCWVAKLDSAGVLLWQKCYGGTGSEVANMIQQTSDRGYIMAGVSNSVNGDVSGYHGGVGMDIWVVKLDSAGNIQWQKCYGGTNYEATGTVAQTKDKGYIIAGATYSNDGDVIGNHSVEYDYLVIKVDSLGNIKWSKCYGGTDSDIANCVLQCADGSYVVSGVETSVDGDVTGNHGSSTNSFDDYWVVKLDTAGNIMWQKTYGGTRDDYPYSIQETKDKGFIIGGESQSNDGDLTFHSGTTGYNDYWVVKTDSLGNIKWQKDYGGSFDDNMSSVKQTSDGGYILAGGSDSNNGDVAGPHYGTYDCWIVKLDSTGAISWKQPYGGTQIELATSIVESAPGEYAFAAYSQSNDWNLTLNHGSYDYWVVKLGAIPTAINDQMPIENQVSIFPNPFSENAVVQIRGNEKVQNAELKIFDALGNEVKKVSGINFSSVKIEKEGLNPGVYFYNLKNGEKIHSGKLIIQ